jgi:hypothetical protein
MDASILGGPCVDVNTHTLACASQLAACVSHYYLPLPACLRALCIVKVMLLLVDGARWRNDAVAARCVVQPVRQPVASPPSARWLLSHTITRASNQSSVLL